MSISTPNFLIRLFLNSSSRLPHLLLKRLNRNSAPPAHLLSLPVQLTIHYFHPSRNWQICRPDTNVMHFFIMSPLPCNCKITLPRTSGFTVFTVKTIFFYKRYLLTMHYSPPHGIDTLQRHFCTSRTLPSLQQQVPHSSAQTTICMLLRNTAVIITIV